MNNYLIGSVSSKSEDYYLNEAFLFEVEYINGPPTLMDIQTLTNYEKVNAKKPLRKQDEKRVGYHRVTYLKFFKIKKIIMKATDGTNHIRGKKLNEAVLEERTKSLINFPSNREHFIHYRYKMSKDDLNIIKIGDVYCCPDDMTNLRFEEENEKDAIKFFKYIVPNLYFGHMNSNINFDWIDYRRNFNNYYTGKSEYIGPLKKYGISKSDYEDIIKYTFDTVCGKLTFNISDSDISYNLWGEISREFRNKLSFLSIILDKTVENFIMLFDLIKSIVPEFEAFYLRPMSFDIDYMKCPLPCFKFSDGFDLSLKHLEKELHLITDNYKNFLLSRDYFIMDADYEDLDAISSGLKFLSNSINIQSLLEEEPKKLKNFLEERNKNGNKK